MKKSHFNTMLVATVVFVGTLILHEPASSSHYHGGLMTWFQFRATDIGGSPVADGNYPAIFTLYAVPAGGTVLWAETLSVATTDGLVGTNLGLIHALSSEVVESAILQNNNNNGFLEVTFNGEIISPRFRLAAAPYAKVSDRVLGDIQTGPDQLSIGDDDSPMQLFCDMSTDGGGWTIVKNPSDTVAHLDTFGLKLSDAGLSVGTPPAITFNGSNYLVVWDGSDTAIHATPNGIALGANAVNGLALGAPVGAAPNAQLQNNALAMRRGAVVAARLAVAGGARGEVLLADLDENITLNFTTSEVTYVHDDKQVRVGWEDSKLLCRIDGSDTAGFGGVGGNLELFAAPGKTLSVPSTSGSVDIQAPTSIASLACPDFDADGNVDFATAAITATSSSFTMDAASTFDCDGSATFALPVHIGGGAPPPPGSFLHVNGNITATGAKLFVQENPKDPSQYIAFVALEGPEAGTYSRGTFELKNGVAEIRLPESFSLVTANNGLTAQITPRGKVNGMLYVESVTPSKLVVKSSSELDSSVSFDYLVNGVRIGYENFESLRKKEITNSDGSPTLSLK